jgi:Phage capsid protein
MGGTNNNIPTLYVEQFSSNVGLLVQQKVSRLRGAVMSGSHVGSQASPLDQFGAVNAQKVEGRFQPIEPTDAPTNRRWVYPQDYDLAQYLDAFDKLRLLIDPMSTMVQDAVAALSRAMDTEILNGIFNANFTGNNGATSTSLGTNTTGTGQTVGVQQGAASSTNLTVAKLRFAKRLLLSYEAIQLEDHNEIFSAINAQNHDNLLSEMQVISMDFNDRPVMPDGWIDRFLGVQFIHTELLPTGSDDQSGTSTKVPMWVKSGVYLGIWNDIETNVSQRHDLRSLPYQAYVKGTFGGTRLEEKKVQMMWCH